MSLLRTSLLALVLALLPAWAAAQTVCTGFAEDSVPGVDTDTATFTGVAAGTSLIFTATGTTDETHTMGVEDDSANGSYTVSGASDDPGGTGRKYTAAFANSVADDGTIIATATWSVAMSGFFRHVSCNTAAGVTLEQIVNDADGEGSSTTYASPAVTTTCSAGTLVFLPWVNSARTMTSDVGTDVGAASQRQHGFYVNFSSSGLQPTMTATASSAARWTAQVVVLCNAAGGVTPRGSLMGVLP